MSVQFLEATIAIHLVYTRKEGIPLLRIVPYWGSYRFLCCHEYQVKSLLFPQSVPITKKDIATLINIVILYYTL